LISTPTVFCQSKALDKGTGKEQKITITASSGLSKDEVAKMQREAEAHAAEDTARKDLAEAKNQGDTMAYQAEKMLRDNKDKVPADLNTEITAKVEAVKQALQGSDTAALKSATQALSESMQKLEKQCTSSNRRPAPSRLLQEKRVVKSPATKALSRVNSAKFS